MTALWGEQKIHAMQERLQWVDEKLLEVKKLKIEAMTERIMGGASSFEDKKLKIKEMIESVMDSSPDHWLNFECDGEKKKLTFDYINHIKYTIFS